MAAVRQDPESMILVRRDDGFVSDVLLENLKVRTRGKTGTPSYQYQRSIQDAVGL